MIVVDKAVALAVVAGLLVCLWLAEWAGAEIWNLEDR